MNEKTLKFVLYQLKVRLFYSEVLEARHIDKVRVSDKKRTFHFITR